MIKKVFIEITNVCNLRCTFCPGTLRPQAYLTEQGFARVLDALSGKAQSLYFHLMGEPLLHPLLGRFLDMADNAGFPVNLTTNGTLLRREGESLINKPALRQVNISLHSQTEAGITGDYLENALAFAHKARADDGRILIALRMWNMSEGAEDAETERALERIAREYGLDRVALNDRQDGRGAKLAEGVFLNRSMSFEWPDINGPEAGSRGYCRGLRDQVGILCGGTVVPCCLDSEGAMALGNIYEQPFEVLLATPRATAIAEGFARREAVEELCRRCGYRSRFGQANGKGRLNNV